MIRLTLAALAVTIALPALANGDWPDKPEQPVKEEPKPDPKPEPEPETQEPETPTPEPEPEPETPTPEPEEPGCPDCENPPKPQPEPEQPETPAEPRDRYTPQASDRETRFARAEPCCTRDGAIYAKRTMFGIGQGKAVEYCAKVDPATIPVCDVKVKP